MHEKPPRVIPDDKKSGISHDLVTTALTIANSPNTLVPGEFTSVNICDSSHSGEIRDAMNNALEENITMRLANGEVIVIDDEAVGLVIGLEQVKTDLNVAIVQRFGHGPHATQSISIPDGQFSFQFDTTGRCIVQIGDKDGTDSLKVSSPTQKRRPQDSFSIYSGKVKSEQIDLPASSRSLTTSFVTHKDNHHHFSHPHNKKGEGEQPVPFFTTIWEEKVGSADSFYVTVNQTILSELPAVAFDAKYITDRETLLTEDALNNKKPWAQENLVIRPGHWLVKSLS